MFDVIPAPSAAQQNLALEKAMDYLAERGVTTVHDMGYDWDDLAVHRRAHANNTLRTRIYAIVPLATWQRKAGNLADVVILDQDITAIPVEQIVNTRVVRTIIGGKTVYPHD